MAVLNNTLVNGILRLNGDLLASGLIDVSGGTLKGRIINLPTAAGGSTYGAGTDGQIVVSNGTHAYWVTPPTATITPVSASGTATALTGVKVSSTVKVYQDEGIVFNKDTFLKSYTFNNASPFTGISTTKPTFSGTQGNVSVVGIPLGYVTLTLNDSPVNESRDAQVGTAVVNSAPYVDSTSTNGLSIVTSVSSSKGDYTPVGSISLGQNTTSTGGVQYVESIDSPSNIWYGVSRTTSGSGRTARRTLVVNIDSNGVTATTKYFHPSFSGTKTNDLVTSVTPTSQYLHTNVSLTKKYLHAAFTGEETTSTGSFTPSGTVTLNANNFTTTSVLKSVTETNTAQAVTSIKEAECTTVNVATGIGANGTTSVVTGLTNGTSFTVLKSTK